jgi:hypothetical protein
MHGPKHLKFRDEVKEKAANQKQRGRPPKVIQLSQPENLNWLDLSFDPLRSASQPIRSDNDRNFSDDDDDEDYNITRTCVEPSFGDTDRANCDKNLSREIHAEVNIQLSTLDTRTARRSHINILQWQ